MNRRDFFRKVGTAAAVGAAIPLVAGSTGLTDAESAKLKALLAERDKLRAGLLTANEARARDGLDGIDGPSCKDGVDGEVNGCVATKQADGGWTLRATYGKPHYINLWQA